MIINVHSVIISLTTILLTAEYVVGCGYQSCPAVKDGYVNVHLIPHTHDDVGWLKTVDQYYYGTKNEIQNAQVQYIITSAVTALLKDKKRRFIYVETSFFWKWWNEQSDSDKLVVKKLVESGQLEFIGGGWSMNDEAVTNYQAIIDQMTLGLQRLNDTFGECGRPKIGWQIDPFGHSSEMASIFAQLGYDGMLVGRIDYEDEDNRLKNKEMEVVWRGSRNLGNSSDIFTGVIYNSYHPPSGFCFDLLCGGDSIIDDESLPDYNLYSKVTLFLADVYKIQENFKTQNILVPMGADFNYIVAEMWYSNIDKLMKYINNSTEKVNLIYSTPSCYVKAVRDESEGKFKWNMKTDDFLPYRSSAQTPWTGFYTSRPSLKRYERFGNNFLQVCKQLYALAGLGEEHRQKLDRLREEMGIMQHHDAVTGTEKQHVAFDYARRLAIGFEKCLDISGAALRKFVGIPKNVSFDESLGDGPIFKHCPLLNVSQCKFIENHDSFVVTVYNPLSVTVSKYIRLPVLDGHYSVRNPNGTNLTTDTIPIPQVNKKIPGRNSKANHELLFYAEDIPPLGFKSFYIQREKKNASSDIEDFQSDIKINLNSTSGLIREIVTNNETFAFNQKFFYYDDGDSSGAYVFLPRNHQSKVVANIAHNDIFKGNLVYEIRQKFGYWISQVVRVYSKENYIEFDWIVGPIPISEIEGNNVGKNVVTRYTTDIKSNDIFYTDSNGREMLRRKRNHRDSWKVKITESISENYYPITSKILIKDGKKEMAVLTDRAEGGTSLKSGEVEIMLHRLCTHDDGLGVAEALTENAFGEGLVAKGSHFIVLGKNNETNINGNNVAVETRLLQHQRLLSSWIFLSSTQGLTFEQYKAQYKMEFAGLKRNLPQNVKILTLEPWKESSFLLRFEHIFEKDEDNDFSKPVDVDLKELFSTFEVTAIKETTLGGNQWLKDSQRLQFAVNETSTGEEDEDFTTTQGAKINDGRLEDNFIITLNPMQIRTFIIDIKTK